MPGKPSRRRAHRKYWIRVLVSRGMSQEDAERDVVKIRRRWLRQEREFEQKKAAGLLADARDTVAQKQNDPPASGS